MSVAFSACSSFRMLSFWNCHTVRLYLIFETLATIFLHGWGKYLLENLILERILAQNLNNGGMTDMLAIIDKLKGNPIVTNMLILTGFAFTGLARFIFLRAQFDALAYKLFSEGLSGLYVLGFGLFVVTGMFIGVLGMGKLEKSPVAMGILTFLIGVPAGVLVFILF